MHIIKWQLRLGITKKEFWIALYILMLLVVVSFVTHCFESLFGVVEMIYTFSASTVFVLHSSHHPYSTLFVLIVPLIIPLALSDSLFTERLKKTDTLLYTRISSTKYMLSKAVSCFVLGFFIVLIPLAMSQVLSLIAFPFTSPRPFTSTSSSSMGFAKAFSFISLNWLYFGHPYIYNIVFSIFLAIYAGCCSVIALSISIYIKKHRSVVISSVFILTVVSMLIGHYLRVSGHTDNKSLVIINYFIVADDISKYEYWKILAIVIIIMILSLGPILYKGIAEDHL